MLTENDYDVFLDQYMTLVSLNGCKPDDDELIADFQDSFWVMLSKFFVCIKEDATKLMKMRYSIFIYIL